MVLSSELSSPDPTWKTGQQRCPTLGHCGGSLSDGSRSTEHKTRPTLPRPCPACSQLQDPRLACSDPRLCTTCPITSLHSLPLQQPHVQVT